MLAREKERGPTYEGCAFEFWSEIPNLLVRCEGDAAAVLVSLVVGLGSGFGFSSFVFVLPVLPCDNCY